MMDDRLQRAKAVDIVQYLSGMGHSPQRETAVVCKYSSPIRSESDPSFYVNKETNSWMDHGNKEHGDVIDLVQKMEDCGFQEALDRLLDAERPRGTYIPRDKYDPPAAIEVLGTNPKITNPTIVNYLENERKIPIEIANRYCDEVLFQFPSKKYVSYYGAGMLNDAGGWSLRSVWFKGSTSPAAISTVKQAEDSNSIGLWEGMVDWLSYVVLHGEPSYKCIVLNSLVYIPFLLEELKQCDVVHWWGDNDVAADEKTELMLAEHITLMDHRGEYSGYGDLNEYLKDK